MAQFNPLRPVTQRLNSTPVEELPRYAGYLATSILNCSDLLQSWEGSKNDAFVQIHKLTTRVTSLLQDRTQEGRFTGIVLVKALVEASSSQLLATSGSAWVRGLLLCLNKQDPAQVKLLAIITITRIFLLTEGNQSMLREITSPSLPAFITACMNAIKPRVATVNDVEKQIPSVLLQPVLQCWTQLIRMFPSTFRPFVPSIRAITLSLLSQHIIAQDVKDVASEIFSSLHFCAPKDTAGADWAQSLKQIIEAAHQTADLVFRSIVEEWSSALGRQNLSRAGKKPTAEPRFSTADAVGMDAWASMWSGCTRLSSLLQMLETMISSPHAQIMKIPVAEILDLTTRLAAVLLPNKAYALRENKEISRDEREDLYVNLPKLHRAVLAIYGRIAETFGHTLIPISHQLLSHVWDILATESADVYTRTSLYETIKTLLIKNVVQITNSDSEHIGSLIQNCCQDLKSVDGKRIAINGGLKDSKSGTLSIESQPQTKQQRVTTQSQSALEQAASALLPILITCTPHSVLSSNIRTELDRTAISLGHDKGLLASVMYPPVPRKGGRAAPSTLPFLARNSGDSLEVEALMRPRMPVIPIPRLIDDDEDMEDDEDDEGKEENEENEAADAILHAVDDHVSRQLMTDQAMDDRPDVLPARKRDYATAEEEKEVLYAEEASKKARIIAPLPADELLPDSPSATQLQNEVKEAGDHAGIIESPGQANLMASSAADDVAVLAPEEVNTSNLGAHMISEHDDDSDGSEIPQIDTALSSDDEDEDEDDEMDN